MDKWNAGVHRKKAGKRQGQEVESHNTTHEDGFYTIKQVIKWLKGDTFLNWPRETAVADMEQAE